MDDLDDLLNSIRNEDEDEDDIPEGLDDLLESIVNDVKEVKKEVGGKPQSSSALAVIPKPEKKEEDIVDEDIDPLILRLLGIDGTYDIDYDTYKTLLREKIAAGRMPGSKMPTEEIEILTNEFKRVKGKTGRFKVKAQAIRAESFVAKKKETATTKATKALPGIAEGKKVPLIKPSEDTGDEVSESIKLLAGKISDVNNNVKNIVDNDKKKKKLEDKKAEKDRVATDKTRKVLREERSERGKMATGLTNALSSAIAPVKGALDLIGDFLKRILIGTAIMELLKFLENPQEYVNGIARWMNGVISKIEDGIRDIIKTKILAPINNVINGVNNGIQSIVDKINDLIDKIPGNVIPKLDLSGLKIGTVDPSIIDNIITLPRVPMVGNALPTSTPSPIQQGQPQPQQGQPQRQPQGRSSGNASGISANARALLNTIRYAEGTSGPNGYNTWFGGRSDLDLSKLTINQVVSEQKRRIKSGEATYGKYTSAAVGAYQMMKPEVFARRAGLDPATAKFTPENQDKMAIAGYMKGQAGMTQAEIDAPISRQQIAKMAPVWASLPMMNGKSRYGQPVKRYSDLEKKYNQYLNQNQKVSVTQQSNPQQLSVNNNLTTTTQASTPVQVSKPSPNLEPPAAPGSTGLTNIPIPVATGGQQSNQTSVASASQKVPPSFSAYDKTNSNWLVIKSIYNIVG